MNEKLENALLEKYPLMFEGYTQGFACGDGWYYLIDTLCLSITSDITQKERDVAFHQKMLDEQNRSDWTPYMREIWTPEKLIPKIEAYEQSKKIRVAQVKEKFGGLRFYVDNSTKEQNIKIAFAEDMSYRICEDCGTMENVMRYPLGWVRSLCNKHANSAYGKNKAEKYRNEQKCL
jgi:hypothetical protein